MLLNPKRRAEEIQKVYIILNKTKMVVYFEKSNIQEATRDQSLFSKNGGIPCLNRGNIFRLNYFFSLTEDAIPNRDQVSRVAQCMT